MFLLQLKEVNRHPWVVAGGKGELELEDPMMDVVQTHIIPGDDTIDEDVVLVKFILFLNTDHLLMEEMNSNRFDFAKQDFSYEYQEVVDYSQLRVLLILNLGLRWMFQFLLEIRSCKLLFCCYLRNSLSLRTRSGRKLILSTFRP